MRVRKNHSIALFSAIALIASLTVAVAAEKSGRFETSMTVRLPGLSGTINNVVYLSDGKSLVAPFAPSEGFSESATESEVGEAERLDNHYLHLVGKGGETGEVLQSVDLGCYYPTRIVFDHTTKTFFVRATEFVRSGDGETGEQWQPGEVLAFGRLNEKYGLEQSVFRVRIPAATPDDPTALTIPETREKWASSAPSVLASGYGGRFVLFSNGASVFAFNLSEGYTKQVDLVQPTEFSQTNT